MRVRRLLFVFASILFGGATSVYAALGAGLMGIWSATLFGSGGAIQWQRWQGTLEILVSGGEQAQRAAELLEAQGYSVVFAAEFEENG